MYSANNEKYLLAGLLVLLAYPSVAGEPQGPQQAWELLPYASTAEGYKDYETDVPLSELKTQSRAQIHARLIAASDRLVPLVTPHKGKDCAFYFEKANDPTQESLSIALVTLIGSVDPELRDAWYYYMIDSQSSWWRRIITRQFQYKPMMKLFREACYEHETTVEQAVEFLLAGPVGIEESRKMLTLYEKR